MMSSVCPAPRGLQSTGQTTLHWSSSSNRYSSSTSIGNNTNARHSWTPVRSASTGISTTALHSWAASRNSISSSPSMTGGITINTSPSGMTTPVDRRSWSPVHRPRSAPGYNNGHHRLSAPAAPSIETEEEYVEFYQQRILTAQQRQLLPLQEDLADWLNKLLGELILIIITIRNNFSSQLKLYCKIIVYVNPLCNLIILYNNLFINV
jgi:hypothetical protein